MFSLLRSKTQQEQGVTNSRISVRDQLLTREIQEMGQLLPSNCTVMHENVNDLSNFILSVKPTEGFWKGGNFKFNILVTEEYNMAPPVVKCLTRLWHPNISEAGEVCLSLLRLKSVDIGMGWSPSRSLKDVIWGLQDLFMDLLNFDDPLNIEAAEMYRNNKDEFIQKVRDYIATYAKDD